MRATDEDRRWPPARVLALLARVFRVLSAPFVRYEIRGGRCASELTVAVIAANHRSMFDAVAGLVCLHHFGHYPRLLIERRYVERGVLGYLSRGIGAIPVDRGDGRDALDSGVAALTAGIPILVMPEGGLHWDPDHPLGTGPARTGVARLAVRGGVPVVPVALAGTERVAPPGCRFPRANPFRRKTVVCWVADDPLWLDGVDTRADTEVVMAAIRDLLVRAQPLVDGPRPNGPE